MYVYGVHFQLSRNIIVYLIFSKRMQLFLMNSLLNQEEINIHYLNKSIIAFSFFSHSQR